MTTRQKLSGLQPWPGLSPELLLSELRDVLRREVELDCDRAVGNWGSARSSRSMASLAPLETWETPMPVTPRIPTRVLLAGVCAAVLGALLIGPAFGQADPAPQPFELQFDGEVTETSQLAGNRIRGEVSGLIKSAGFSGLATGGYLMYTLKKNLVKSWSINAEAEGTPGFVLSVRCALPSNPHGEDLAIKGNCVLSSSDQSVHGTGKLLGTLDPQPDGKLSLKLVGKGSCGNLDPKLCPSAQT